MFAWMYRNCARCKAPEGAIDKGHQGCLYYMYRTRPPYSKSELADHMLAIVNKNNLALLYVVLKQKPPLDKRMVYAAAKVRNLDLVKYLVNLNYPWDPAVLQLAVSRDDANLINYVLKNDLPYDRLDCQVAAVKANNIPFLQYFVTRDIPLKTELTYCAAFHGRFDVLTYCVDHGCVMMEDAILGAVRGNHTRCLIYLMHLPYYNNEVTWFAKAVVEAVREGAYECMMHLCKDRPVETIATSAKLLEMVTMAADRSDRKMCLYLLCLYKLSLSRDRDAQPARPAQPPPYTPVMV